jgi:hypothetical protein
MSLSGAEPSVSIRSSAYLQLLVWCETAARFGAYTAILHAKTTSGSVAVVEFYDHTTGARAQIGPNSSRSASVRDIQNVGGNRGTCCGSVLERAN